jgi:hypothetical protein
MLDGDEFCSVLTVQASFDGTLSLEHQRDCETLVCALLSVQP